MGDNWACIHFDLLILKHVQNTYTLSFSIDGSGTHVDVKFK